MSEKEAKMAVTCTEDGSIPQWGDPRGGWGRVALALMAAKNGGNNNAALDALGPQPGESILEIGVGPGLALKHVLRHVGRKGFVGGIDHSALAAERTRRRLSRAIREGRAQIYEASVSDIPFKDEMFDGAFAVNSFQFWPDLVNDLREVARVLRPKGRLVLTQRAANKDVKMDLAGAKGGWARIDIGADALPKAGFEVVEVTDRPVGRLVAASIIARKI